MRLFGLTARAIRHYEEWGLITAMRDRRNNRCFDERARARLGWISTLRAADLMKPELVQRNETVTLTYEMPGIKLSVRGKAIEGGAEGVRDASMSQGENRA